MRLSQFLPPLTGSLPAKLVVFIAICLGTIGAARLLGVDRIADIDSASEQVRHRFGSVGLLGRLQDLTADVRAGEADVLLSLDPDSRIVRSVDLQKLLDATSKVIGLYQPQPRDSEQALAFNNFRRHWAEHVPDLERIVSMSKEGRQDEAVALFNGPARATFRQAVDELERLSRLTEAKAAEARRIADGKVNDARRWILDLTLVAFAAFLSISAYLWWNVSRPLLDLGLLMRRLASHDTDFVVKVDDRRDAIGGMARALAILRANTIELIESRKHLSAQTDILAGSLDMERALATEQRNFVTTTSHEFRTPLMTIDGHAQRLVATKDHASPSEIADRAGKMRAAVFRMTSLVASLTEAVELAQGRLRARTRKLDLEEMLRGLARYYREIGMDDALEEQFDQLPAEIVGDPELLYQVFSNLLSNAFKYSPDGSTVSLKASSKDGKVEIVVEDHGVGIPRGELGRVRERYYRASNVGTIPGTGTGLYLVDEIVRQHRGSVEIESNEGVGTRVVVTLPTDVGESRVDQNIVR
jgi:signal transduction histidine kinase